MWEVWRWIRQGLCPVYRELEGKLGRQNKELMSTHWGKQRMQWESQGRSGKTQGGCNPRAEPGRRIHFSQVEGPHGRKENVRPLVTQGSVRDMGKMRLQRWQGLHPAGPGPSSWWGEGDDTVCLQKGPTACYVEDGEDGEVYRKWGDPLQRVFAEPLCSPAGRQSDSWCHPHFTDAAGEAMRRLTSPESCTAR